VVVGLTASEPPLAGTVVVTPPPLTVTVVAFVALTLRSDEFEAVIEEGVAAIVTVGDGFGVTVIRMELVLLPPAPVAVAVYVVDAAGLTVCVPPTPGSL
jgi:hypothetical protein